MSETNHPWCRDVPRDEAVRVAEDAAAGGRTPVPDHRDLPQAVADLRERGAKIEETMVSGSTWFPKSDKPAPPAPPAPPKPGWIRAWNRENELAAERDTARAEAQRLRRPATWQEEEAAVEAAWSLCGLEPDWPSDEPGTIVRHAESMRREIGRLRDRVAELESAPAANAGGEKPQPPLKVKVPSQPAVFSRAAWNLCVSRWIAAIRAAGGEVE